MGFGLRGTRTGGRTVCVCVCVREREREREGKREGGREGETQGEKGEIDKGERKEREGMWYNIYSKVGITETCSMDH